MKIQDYELHAVSAVDGRYRNKVEELAPIVSESGLIQRRLKVELAWLMHLAADPVISKDLRLCDSLKIKMQHWFNELPIDASEKIKVIEKTTNHDVKAVEYYIRQLLQDEGAEDQVQAFVHFACTSEDINNLAYALMLHDARKVFMPIMIEIITLIMQKAEHYAELPMLSRTHGQTASPTTLGKELMVFAHRLNKVLQRFKTVAIEGKINGAVGNFNAHISAYPEVDWQKFAKTMIEDRLGLKENPLTTQIENHDSMVEFVEVMQRFNTILLGFCRDLWSYISLDYFKLALKENEVGSSTMPHKVNPIDFENAEGNLGIANSLATHFGEKLPISRWQRDLSDSTVQRALGTFFSHTLIAYKAFLKGFEKITANHPAIDHDLARSWEVLAEPIQTVMRRYGIADAYERLKVATRGKAVSKEVLHKLILDTKELPEQAKNSLLTLRPETYVGLAAKLATESMKEIKNAIK